VKITRSIIITLFKQTYFKTDLKEKKRKTCIYYLSKAHTDYCASPFKIWTCFISWIQKPHSVIIESAQSELHSLVQLCKPQSSRPRVLYMVSNQYKFAERRNYLIFARQNCIKLSPNLIVLQSPKHSCFQMKYLIMQHRKKQSKTQQFSHSG